nr:hypothetical protein [Tanacetum cinerariifolium]GEZ58201.1 hypothetical protein [Tanacetum cinerariifolium]GEZ75358.1 hypothetical protein [Tanacetum cinerariifolium]
MARLAFCDYHNMIAILEKYEHNTDFYQIVDFVEASHLRYALTINPTIYVSHIQQFWSTARIKIIDEGTKILATVDGKPRTISESSIRRNLKLKDEVGISSLPDAELFENLTLMGYNILPNQKFSFQKGQFSHQWKYLIYTIMQCLSPKSTGFNEFSSNIATALVCLATNRVYNFLKMIFDGMVRNVNNKVSKFLMYPRFLSKCLKMGQFRQNIHTHTYAVPFHTRKIFTTLRVNNPSFSGRTVPLFPTMLVTMGEGSGTPTEPQYTPSPEAQQTSPTATSSPSLPPVTTTTIPTIIPYDTPQPRQYTRRARIAQSLAFPPVADEPVSPIRDDSQGEACPTDSGLKGRSLDEGEEADVERSTERGVSVAEVPTGSGSIPTASPPGTGVPTSSVPTGSSVVPTASPIFTIATVATPYTRRKGKEKMVESETPKKKKLQEQIDVEMARQLEEEMARNAQRMNEQIARYAKIARIHAEEELQIMIDGLDRNNETVAKLEQDSAKKVKTSEEVSKDDLKDMMQLVPVEEVYMEALQVKHPIINWEIPTEGEKSYWKIIRLGGSTTSYQLFVDMLKHFDREDFNQLWALVKETLNIRQAVNDKENELWVELKRIYDSCGVHRVLSKDQEIFMLVEKDYPLRKGLAIVMISNKLHVENYSQMANDLILKIHQIANSPRQRGVPSASDEFPLAEEVPTASEESFPC